MSARVQLIVAAVAIAALAACSPAVRTHTVRYPNGQPRWVVQTEHRTPHGESASYYPDGTRKSTGRFDRGKRHGVFTFYDERGRLLRRSIFIHGELRWSGTSPSSEPPPDIVAAIAKPEQPEPDTNAAPVYATLDRTALTSQVVAQLGLHRIDDKTGYSSGRRVELFGQGMFGRWGGYGAFTGSMAELEDAGNITGKSVFEIGGVGTFDALDGSLIATAGVAIPAGNDDLEGFGATTAIMSERLNDAALTFPRSTAVRTSVSAIGARGPMFYRVDAGLDLAVDISSESDSVRMKDGAELLGRLGFGVGFANSSGAVTGEMVNVAALTGDASEHFVHSLAVSARLTLWSVEPYSAVVVPVASGDAMSSVAFVMGARYSGGRL